MPPPQCRNRGWAGFPRGVLKIPVARALIVSLVLACHAGLVDSLVPLADVFQKKYTTHMSSGTCDPLALGWSYLSLGVDEAAPFKFSTASVTNADSGVLNGSLHLSNFSSVLRARGEVVVSVNKRTAMHTHLLAYVEDRGSGESSVVNVVYLHSSASTLFLNRGAFTTETIPSPRDSFFYFSSPEQWCAYQQYGKDVLTVTLTDSSLHPRHLSTDGLHVVYADQAHAMRDGRGGGRAMWDIFAYRREGDLLRWKREFLPHQEAADFCEVEMGGVGASGTAATPSPAGGDEGTETHRLYPALCGQRLLYLEVEANASDSTIVSSRIIAYESSTGHTHVYQTSRRVVYGLTSWTVSNEENSCAFAWVECAADRTALKLHTELDETSSGTSASRFDLPYISVDLNASMDMHETLNLSNQSGGSSLFQCEVIVEEHPSLTYRRLVVERDAATEESRQFWEQQASHNIVFTEIVESIQGGGAYLFLKKVDVPRITGYKLSDIKAFGYYYESPSAITTPSFSNDLSIAVVVDDYTTNASRSRINNNADIRDVDIKLHAGIDAAITYHVYYTLESSSHVAQASAFLMARMPVDIASQSGLPDAVKQYTCAFPSDIDPIWVSGHHDTLLVRHYGDTVLSRIDLDKDNDGLFDRQDRFPLSSLDTWDFDNDGISDEADIVDVRRFTTHCQHETLFHVGTCVDDLTVMYIIWATTTVLVLVIAMLVGRLHADLLHKGRLVETHLAEEDPMSDDHLLAYETETHCSNASPRSEASPSRMRRNYSQASIREPEEPVENPSWVDTVRKLVDIRDGMARFALLEMLVQYFLLLLTIVSVVLVIVPLWEKHHLKQSTIETFAWLDLYTASLFAIDLLFRWFFREDKEVTLLQFCKANWFDFPSLVSDLPGLTTSGTLDLLVAARLLRLLRIFKVFRVMRLYRKVTNQNAYVALVVNHSQWLVPIIALLLLLAVAVVIKIVEQEDQEAFESYWNCLWFCFVTATTVGYGDMIPIHWVGRLLACLLMVCGIGMIGNITARVSEKISQTGYQRAQEKERKERHEDHPAIRLALMELSVSFNPMVALKDMRNEHVDVLSHQFMSPRYRDAAVMRQNPRIFQEFKESGSPTGSPNAESTRKASTVDPNTQTPGLHSSIEGVTDMLTISSSASMTESDASSSLSTGIVEIRRLWRGKGHYGRIVKVAFLRATALPATLRTQDKLSAAQSFIPPVEIAEHMRANSELRRLRRSLTAAQQGALEDVLSLLDRSAYQSKIITWEIFEQELVQSQEYAFAVANEMIRKKQQIEWNWNRYSDDHIVRKLRTFREGRTDPLPKCCDKLYLLLLRYKLDESYKGVTEWEKMFLRLNSCIFKRPRKNELVLEKLFSVGCFEDGVGEVEDNPLEQEASYDWQDPIEAVFQEVETILRQHNVHVVEGFQDILFAIESIAMQFERFECTKWALHHLEWGKPGRVVLIPRPPLATEKGRANIINPLLHLPKPMRCVYESVEGACKHYLTYIEYGAAIAQGRDLLGVTIPALGGGGAASDGGASTSSGTDHDVECMGKRCVTRRRLGFGDTRSRTLPDGPLLEEASDNVLLNDRRGYFACPARHFHLCIDCAKSSTQADDQLDGAQSRRSMRSGSRSSLNSTGMIRRAVCPFDQAESVDLDELRDLSVRTSSNLKLDKGTPELVPLDVTLPISLRRVPSQLSDTVTSTNDGQPARRLNSTRTLRRGKRRGSRTSEPHSQAVPEDKELPELYVADSVHDLNSTV